MLLIPILSRRYEETVAEDVRRFEATLQQGFREQTEYLGNDKPVNRIQPKVSVCVATYQHRPYIKQCLDSILCQETAFPFEIIVGEDESTDGTREICVQYAQAHPDKIRLFHRDRSRSQYSFRGQIKWLNAIWTRMSARGKYIALCEGDDYFTDARKLQSQADLLASRVGTALVAHRAQRVRLDGQLVNTWPEPQPAVLDQKRIIRRAGSAFATNSMMFPRVLLQQMPAWFHLFPAGDCAIVNLAAQRGPILFSNAVMSAYREQVPGSWSARHNTRGIKSQILLMTARTYFVMARSAPMWKSTYFFEALRLCYLACRVVLLLGLKRRGASE